MTIKHKLIPMVGGIYRGDMLRRGNVRREKEPHQLSEENHYHVSCKERCIADDHENAEG
jgi:hypothetical protein